MNKATIIFIIIIAVISAGIIYSFYVASINSPEQKPTENNIDQNNQNNNSNKFEIQSMKIEILKEGSGDAAKTGDKVTVNYTGTLLDGTKFDSSLNPGRTPFEFSLPGQVIQGWNLGVLGMKVGEKRKLTIPPELAYGAQSPSPLIPANSTLLFEIDLLGIGK